MAWGERRPPAGISAMHRGSGQLHFSIPNHGRLWKALMGAHQGDWEKAAERLERHAAGQSADQAKR